MAKSRRTPELVRIGTVIKARREALGEVRRVFAERAGISADHLKDIENGHQPARRVMYQRIAAALDMDEGEMDELTGQKVAVK